MIPLSRTVCLWRRYRNLTQAELARRAGISRPNLSAMERGSRDMTVGTLRNLAHSLSVRPGVLADGIPPGAFRKNPLTRSNLDHIARWAARGVRAPLKRPPLSPVEREIAELVRPLVRCKLKLNRIPVGAINRKHFGVREFERLKSIVSPSELSSLLNRIDKKLQSKYEPQRN